MYFAIVTLITASCSSKSTKRAALNEDQIKVELTIVKIDSIGNYFLVYGALNDDTFKIISKKSNGQIGEPIKVGDRYIFLLGSVFSMGSNRDNRITPITDDLVNCIGVDSVTTICKEKGCVQDLFRSDNLRGIVYVNP